MNPDDLRPSLAEASASLCLVFILLVPLAGAGLSLINTGLNRSRSAAHALLTSLCLAAVAVLAFFVCGSAFSGLRDGWHYSFMAGGREWDWIGASPLFLSRVPWDDWRTSLTIFLELMSIAVAAVIPAAAAAERWRLAAACVSTALFGGWTFPLFAHWVWGGGWLARLGTNYSLGHGFLDPGGAASIHTTGALTALAIAWILGPRRGKFSATGMPTAMPGHNAVIVLFGCMLTLLGFFGLNSAGSLLFAGTTAVHCVLVDVNTFVCAAAGALATLVTTRVRFGRPDASLVANGWVAGLVSSSATSAFVKPAEAAFVGLVAGALIVFSIEAIELRMKVDDPAGAISVHGISGIWSILALGIFGSFGNATPEADSGQFLAQLIGAATLLGVVLPLAYGLNWLLNRVMPQRVAVEGERQGMDLFELGAGAYPDFVTHRDDFMRR